MPGTDRKTVLVVDDEALFRNTIVEAIQECAGTVHVIGVADGAAAIEVLETTPVHVLVTDLQMPRVDGVSLIKTVLNRAYPLAVVVTTAHATPALERWATAQLAFAVLEKPIDLGELLNVVQRLLEPTETGHFEGVTLPGLCQLLQIERKTCSLRVHAGTGVGRLIFRDGRLEDAVHQDAVGDAAAMDILTWEAPTVEMSGRVPPRGVNRVTEDVMYLLMEAVRVLDERSRPGSVQEPRSSGRWRTDGPPPSTKAALPSARGSAPALSDRPAPFVAEPPAARGSVRSHELSRGGSRVLPVGDSPPLSASSRGVFPPGALADAVAGQVALAGFLSVAVVDVASGAVLDVAGNPGPALTAVAVACADMLRAARRAIAADRPGDDVDDLLVTHGGRYHMLRRLHCRATTFLLLVLDRQLGTLALARLWLTQVDRAISVDAVR